MTKDTHEAPAPASIESISVIKFGPGNVLFVGDSATATITAFEVGDGQEGAPRPFNLYGVDQSIADLLGVDVGKIAVRGLAVHPVTGEAYIGIHRRSGYQVTPIIVRVAADGAIHPVDLEALRRTQITLPNPVNPDVKLWNNVAARSLAITDMLVVGDELFVSGLSNADFASTLYRITLPFTGAIRASSVEIYHGVHGQNETRAPIQTMTLLDLNGSPHVLAVYTCTPLVTIPTSELVDGAHVKGKTIAELGYGNTPLDVVHFRGNDMEGHAQESVLITHKHRGTMVFRVAALAERNQQGSISEPTGLKVSAPEFATVSMAGLVHVVDQDAGHLLALRRDQSSGRLDLLSFQKGPMFRLSDHVSEYMLPGFPYSEQPESMKQFHRWMKNDEGFH
ncbi:MAG: hypothetical protein L6Q76_02870 [Polyangiaceae bacterium]|nr:hypothetical protein [Polyangiaceae bacterium]